MGMTEIETIKNTIHQKYHLKRDHRHWVLNEQPTVKLRVPNCHSIGFSLDNQNHPLAFFSTEPPKHLRKTPDAILALKYQRKIYWFIVEQKTAHKCSYKDQLINGKYFCDWIIALCKQYGYLHSDSVCIGLLVWQPREKFVCKGTTSHHNNQPEAIQVDTFQHSFEVRDILDFSLNEVLQSL